MIVNGWPVKSPCGLVEYDFHGCEPVSVDDIVYTVQLAAVDESKKERWLAAHRRRKEQEMAKRDQECLQNVIPEYESQSRFARGETKIIQTVS